MSVKITRTKDTVYNITAAVFPFNKYTERFKAIRSGAKYKASACFNCRKRFEIGETMGLIFTDRGNRVVCEKCALEIEKELKEAETNG